MSTEIEPSIRALLQLVLTPGLGPIRLNRLLAHFGSAEAICTSSARSLSMVEGIGRTTATSIVESMREVEKDVDLELELVEEHSVTLLPITDPAYPQLLKHVPDPPPLLYTLGAFDWPRDEMSVAIVGSRRCSAYGREQASRFGAGLAQSGFTVTSGGARGIDTEAHRGALRVNGRTIAVLGCGLAQVYPRENQVLYNEIADERGVVISEFPMTTPPNAENFPRRNRIISGLSLGTVVIEASARSGALITARMACEDHNREVMVLPGRVDSPNSEGCHRILREGWARLVTNVAEVIEALDESGSQHLLHAARTQPAHDGLFDATSVNDEERPSATDKNGDGDGRIALHGLTDSQLTVFDSLDTDPIEIDDLAIATGLEIPQLQADLTILQIRGLIIRTPAGGIQRRKM